MTSRVAMIRRCRPVRNVLHHVMKGGKQHGLVQRKTIVVPFDFSEESNSAVEVARQLAEEATDIHAIHVLPELLATEPGVIWGVIDDESRKEHAKEAMLERLASLECKDVRADVQVGDPGHVIVQLAEEHGASLIIIPSHGRTGMKRVLMGSVAERVVRHAHCPVLVLKKGSES